ncbi:LytR/AlgR family response regulator transcription factor [Larkinella punicea]|uniref:DNA-binding response regulator n=1 Tax=Larkinella punicea TaxID=2315727 RepID=A0A368JPY4_9BACT|nr:LytTR family DNA-binding domain-containing protein [Larkinella punicea]RCR69729.1 DNA-binding response regulator [Larkinella punicea]
MKILIVEDEPLAVKRMEGLIREVAPDAEIVGKIDTVRAFVRWWQTNPAPDLLLMDIQLADGLSFEIFQQVEVKTPVIFTTAYDEYALRAFKVNSVDYLLKPIEQEELVKAIQKFRHQRQSADSQPGASENLVKMLEEFGIKPVTYKSRFLIKQGGRFDVVETSDILYLYADDKVVFLITNQNRKYIVDETLDELEAKLDPRHFFRINRKYITHLSAIERIEPYFNGRLRIWLKHRPSEEEVSVSRERADSFKGWLNT